MVPDDIMLFFGYGNYRKPNNNRYILGRFLLSQSFPWLLLPLVRCLPLLIEDLPGSDEHLFLVEDSTSAITHVSEDEPRHYNVVVAQKDSNEETVAEEDSKSFPQEALRGDQICPGDLDLCLEACLPVLAILELAHTYCVEECYQRCAP